MRRAVLLALALSLTAAAAASAQPSPGRIEGAIGLAWVGGQGLGSAIANETTAGGGSRPLFLTSSQLSAAPGAELRIGVRITNRLQAEVSGTYLTAPLTIHVTADAEGAANVDATEHIQQFSVSVGALWYLTRGKGAATRVAPFVAGDVGYLRQLHGIGTLVEDGRVYQIGGGAKVTLWSRDRGKLKSAGVRLDVRAMLRAEGVAFDGGVHTSPVVGATFFIRF